MTFTEYRMQEQVYLVSDLVKLNDHPWRNCYTGGTLY